MKKVVVLSLFLLMVPSCTKWFSSETPQEKAADAIADKVAATREKMQKLDMQIAAFKEKVGVLPGELKELVEGPKDESQRKNWSEALVSEADLVDAWGQPFMYTVSTTEGAAPYELFSVGEKTETKEA